MPRAAEPDPSTPETNDSVGSLAELYLGNILYAIELTAVSMEEQGQPDNAAFYRAIARKLAQARGRAKSTP